MSLRGAQRRSNPAFMSRLPRSLRSLAMTASLGDHAAAGGSGAGGAAITVQPCDDLTTGQQGEIELLDGLRQRAVHRQGPPLIEGAVVEPAVPTHTDQVPAHETVHGSRVEAGDEFLHVGLVLAGAVQIVQ